MATAKKYRQWVLWLAGFLLAAIGLFALPQAALAGGPGTGTIEGGPYTVELDGDELPVNGDNTTVTLSPSAGGADVNIDDNGNISITNVPAGTYQVTVAFSITEEACNKNWFTSIVTGLSPALIAFCGATDIADTYFGTEKVFSGVVVRSGQVTTLTGPSSGVLGQAVMTNASGQPIVDCAGKGLLMSWIVCPMIESVLGVMDWTLNNFIQPFLAINPLATTNEDGSPSQLYEIWNNIRNFANLVFIAAFFVIVFSQATSVGISNYGIKRLLPRLVLIAIGTNISFFICAFLVDLFNVLGIGAASLMITSIVDGQPSITVGSDIFNIMFQGGPFGAMSSILAQGALTAAIIFGIFIFLIIAAAILFIAAVVVMLRQIAIIFLIIVSPLAFVAGLLPNTQKYFSGWFSMFGRLLAMYPLMMILFASGKIASTIIQQIGVG